MNGIEIDFTAGFGDAAAEVPNALRQAILLHVAAMYELRGAVAVANQPASLPAGYDRLLRAVPPEGALMPGLVLDPGALATRLQLQGAEDDAGRAGRRVADSGRPSPRSGAGSSPSPPSARELAGQAGQVVTHRVHLRARPGIAVGMRSRQAGKNVRDQGDARPGRIGTLSRLPVRGGRAMKIAVSVTRARPGAPRPRCRAPGRKRRARSARFARRARRRPAGALAGEPLPSRDRRARQTAPRRTAGGVR